MGLFRKKSDKKIMVVYLDATKINPDKWSEIANNTANDYESKFGDEYHIIVLAGTSNRIEVLS